MEVSQTVETEELMTCLQIQLYHPQQASRALYCMLPLDTRHKHQAEDPMRLGRDAQACTFALADPRYEMLIRRENGEARGSFEVEFGVLAVPPSREMGMPSMVPVVDTGSDLSTNDIPPLMSHGPMEMDETIMYCASFID
ncbi:unnamed protein product [Coregonus sp. 'balchen']|nr:unnamed protein product [Coregonus sp. 'balchen']